jgi:hypothetical protein
MIDEGVAFADAVSLRVRAQPLVVTPGVDRQKRKTEGTSATDTAAPGPPVARAQDEHLQREEQAGFLLFQTAQDDAEGLYGADFAGSPKSFAPRVASTERQESHSTRVGQIRRAFRFRTVQGALLLSVIVAIPPALALLRYAEVKRIYGETIANRTAIAVHMGPELAGVMRRPGSNPDALILPMQFVASDDIAQMYETAEGGGDHFTYFGLPIRSIARATACHAGLPVPGDCGGASGSLAHLTRSVLGGYGGDHDESRKLREFIDAPALSLLYPEGDVRETTVLNALNFGWLPGGKALIGLPNASLAFWGETDPRKLSLAKQAAIIAAFKYPLAWDNGRGLQQKALDARKRTLNRARDVLVKTFGRNDPRVLAALQELAAPGFLPLRPAKPLIEVDGAVRRMASLELDGIAKGLGSAQITAAELAVPSGVALVQYQSAVVRALRQMKDGGGFTRPLLDGGDDNADGLAVSTAPDGAVTAIVATTPRIGLDSERRVGSHGKWVALIAMARSNLFNADSVLCNRAFDGIQNAGGDTGVANCIGGRDLVPVRTAFGRSLNLPIIDALRRLNDADLQAAAAAAGFVIPAVERNPRRALILGNAEADPASIIALGNALSSFANGGPAIGQYPYIIRRVRVNGVWLTPQRRRPLDLRAFLHGDRSRRLIAAVCAAPLEGGTLSALGVPPSGATVRCGKSATVPGPKEQGYPTISKAVIVSGPSGANYAYLGAPKGVLGASKVSIIPLASAAMGR